MDFIDADLATEKIVWGINNALIEFLPLFVFLGGLALAFVAINIIIGIFRQPENPYANGVIMTRGKRSEELTDDDINYYMSDEYKGNWDLDDPRWDRPD